MLPRLLQTSFSSTFFKMHFCVVVFSILIIGRHIQLLYLHKIFEKRPKDVWKISLDDFHVMMLYGRTKNVNLTRSVVSITITFLKYSLSVPPGSKNNWVYTIFRKKSQERLNCVLKWRVHSNVLWTSPGRQFQTSRTNAFSLHHFQKRISVVIFSVLVHQMCILDTKKLVIAYSFSFGEKLYERPKNVQKWHLQPDVLGTSSRRQFKHFPSNRFLRKFF